ncbi:hypothetical protein B0T26DRAFT_800107 [Lasiosphaeria miniovina]|uniref:Uncharacterized protein n=1 Tax=Lasiosphaeria miniovina TaxID=1954250 RepID=A0AA40E8W2_9PEZI|nr:uncharacterized protein B0T26DRAFT_800107 [Lasiosphaeria miniovina]KAK0728316.1 hypothetical protein B0T26DRAFT_800107 [Lasiosphaeria miniovina]
MVRALSIALIDRALSIALINRSLSLEVRAKIIAQGWDDQETDSKALYDLVKRVVPRLTQEAIVDLVVEYAAIDRTTFTTMPAYYTRAQFLYKKLGELNAGVGENFHLDHLIVTLMEAYPERSLFWLSGLRNKTLDMKSLERDLEEISSSGETTAMFNKVTASKDTENNYYHPGCVETHCNHTGCASLFLVWEDEECSRRCIEWKLAEQEKKNSAIKAKKMKKKLAIRAKKEKETSGTATMPAVLQSGSGNPNTPS